MIPLLGSKGTQSRCTHCGRFGYGEYCHQRKKWLCDACFNDVGALVIEDDSIRMFIDKEAYRIIHRTRGSRAIEGVFEGMKKILARDEHFSDSRPVVTYTPEGVEMSQRVE